MTKRFTKMFSLMAVVFVMMVSMAMPAFAIDCDLDGSGNVTGSGDQKAICTALKEMYGVGSNGEGVFNKGYTLSPDNDHTYGLTITVGNSPIDIYISQRPDVNDVKVQMGTDGRLNVYGMGTGDANTWNQFYAKYKSVIVGISGVGAITFIALFIIQFMKLGASAGNPQARSQALTGCLWTGIAAAALGAVSIIAGFFYNAV